MTLEELKKRLSEELAKETPNHRLIAELTDALLDETSDEVRFSVDAQHINRLGLELVGKQETAVSELIKNAYDADATEVLVEFENYKSRGGKLVISDNGNGMSSDVIRRSWMRLSTDEKNEHPTSPVFGRLRAGKKGIGRFSAQRLGKRLKLESNVAGNATGIRVLFNWDDEFKAGRNLSSIWNSISTYPKDPSEKGTKLIIEELRDRWTEAAFNKVWKSVVFLQPPFKIAKTSTEACADPGFSVAINGKSNSVVSAEFSIEKSFLQHALATITAKIDHRGVATIYLSSPKLKMDEQHVLEEEFLTVGELDFEARYFVFHASVMPGRFVREAQRMGREFGGIRVYRNGFRVLPYGDKADDWLSLGYDAGRRTILSPVNNNNFFGHVEIDKDKNPFLEETSSREGLIENEAFFELRQFTRKVIDWSAERIASVRNRKATSGQRGFQSEVRKPTEVIGDALKKIDGVEGDTRKTAGSREEVRAELNTALGELKAYEDETASRMARMLEYEDMLRILASLGISIAVFSHEIKGAQNSVNSQIALLSKAFLSLGGEESRINLLKQEVSRMFSLGGYVDALVSKHESRELKEVSVEGVIVTFIEQFATYLDRQGILFDIDVEPSHLRTCAVHRSELDSVLFNFLTNSTKSIKSARVKEPRIRISATQDGNAVVLRFEDNGRGIEEEHKERVFDAFFTTSDPDPEDISGRGTGLGLRIVSDIAEAYGGSVAIADPSDGYKCCIEFQIPVSEDQMK